MNISTFNDDLLGLSDFSRRLKAFIDVEHHFVSGGLVLALSSKFGSGKTTFLTMWKASLEAEVPEADRSLVISLNAWESDYYGDPLFAIVSALIEAIPGKDNEHARRLADAAKDVGWFATAIAGQIATKLTGIDAIAAGVLADNKKSEREAGLDFDTFAAYQGRKQAMLRLQHAIKEFVTDSESRVLFLVDELDRCRPDYAISYLEIIKHIFDVQGAVFILAADRKQLENFAKTAFGPDLDFEEYFRKFIHREVVLPPISDEGYRKLASVYVGYYLERKDLRHCIMELSSHRTKNIVELIAALRLTPRQIQEVFRTLGHVLEATEEKQGRLPWCIAVGTIAMAALRIGNVKAFEQLSAGQYDPDEARDLLTDLLGSDHVDWWFMLFLTGGGLKVPDNTLAESVLSKAGLPTRITEHLWQWTSGWGHKSSGGFEEIREKIEQIAQWQ